MKIFPKTEAMDVVKIKNLTVDYNSETVNIIKQ